MKSSAPASIAFVFSGPALAVSMITGSTAVSSLLAEPPADLIAIELRHHDVEENEIRLCGFGELQRGATVGRRDDLVAVGREDGLEQAHVLEDVVDDEDPCGAVLAHRPRPRSAAPRCATSSTMSTGFET